MKLQLPSSEVIVWVIALCLTPLATIYFWPAVYGLYASLLIVPIILASVGNLASPAIQPLLWLKWIVLILVALLHRNTPTIINAGSVVVADFTLAFVLGRVIWTRVEAVTFFRFLFLACVALLAFGIAIGVIAPTAFRVDPILQSIRRGDRLLLFTYHTGHSPLQPVCYLLLILACSNVGNFRPVIRIMTVVGSILLVALSRSADAIPAALIILLVFALESVKGGWRLKNILYVLALIAIVVAAMVPATLSAVLYFVRIQLMHKNLSVYKSDLTAGRALLDKILMNDILNHPFMGIGHDDAVIKYGTQVSMGRQYFYTYALNESELRVPAQYGVPYFLILLAIVCSPLRVLASVNKERRIFAVCVPFVTVTMMLANSELETAHALNYFILTSLIVIASSPTFVVPPSEGKSVVPRAQPLYGRARAVQRRLASG